MEKKAIIAPLGMEIKESAKAHLFPLSAINRNGKTYKRLYPLAKDFFSMPFERQNAFVKNCMVHSAIYRDRKANMKNACLALVREKWEDIYQQSWLNIYESASDEKAESLPLVLFVTIMTSKALRKYLNDSGKPHGNIEDSEYSLPHFESPEIAMIKNITREEIFDLLPTSKKLDIITMLDLKEYGYTIKEIAVIMCITMKTLSQYEKLYQIALAKHCAMNGYSESAREIINSLQAMKYQNEKAQAEKEIALILKGAWQAEKERKAKPLTAWLNLSYIERINAYTNNRELYNKICKLAFNSK